MPLKPGAKLGPYEILGPIGAGGMGEVYRARDQRLSRDVAVKVLPTSVAGDPERLRRFEQEARATGQLNHPNILAIHDTGVHEGIPYVVEELLDGETLRQRMAGSALPPRKAIDYAGQIARGLAAAHQKGIVHRDLKPENVFVTTDGRVKILDFGLAKLVMPGGPTAAFTEAPTQAETGAGVILGTIGYMSPEQVRGQQTDHRSDIFSFGSILYEMISGRRAFRADSSVETMNAILKEEPPELSRSISDLPSGIERIVQHCLEKSPDERFQSARDLAFQIEALSSISTMGSREMPAGVPARSVKRRSILFAALIPLALAAGVVAGRLSRPAPVSAEYSQLTFRQGYLSSARFTPDGGTVIYGAAWEGGPLELFTTRAGSPESRSLAIRSADVLAVSSAGDMAMLLDPRFTFGFQRSGTLARSPLAGGVPRPVLENVQDADFSPDGKELAVARVVEGRYRLEYPVGKVLYETETWFNWPRFSRDGTRIAFIDHPSPGDNRGLVAVVDLSGKVKKLTDAFSSADGLSWSPSGDEIWFTAGRTGNVLAIHAVDLDGRQRVVAGAPTSMTLSDVSPDGKALLTRNTMRRGMMGLAPGEKIERDLSWLDWSRPGDISPDGRWIIFEEQGQGGGPGYSVYLRGTDGSPAVKLGEGYSNSFSPDGSWVATIPVDHRERIVLLPRGAGQPRTLTLDGMNSFGVVWLPGGRLLVHSYETGRLGRLYVLAETGGAPKPVTPEGIRPPYASSKDGKYVAARAGDEVAKIFPIDGGEPRSIPGIEPEDRPVSWTLDGGALFVARDVGRGMRIDRLELASGKRVPWKDLLPSDQSGLLDCGYVNLSDDGESYVYSYRRILSTLYLAQGLR